MTAAVLVMLSMTLTQVPAAEQPFGAAQGAPPPPPTTAAAQQTEPVKPVILVGCVVTSPEMEDSLRLVPAEPEPGRPVGTTGTSPAWTVPAYLLLGGIVSFAEHNNRTVEITGTIAPDDPVVPEPPRTGDTTSRTQTPAIPVARMHVLAVKVIAPTCKPKQDAPKTK